MGEKALLEEIFFNEKYFYVKNIVHNNTLENTRLSYFRESSDSSNNQSLGVEIVAEDHCQLTCKWCYIDQMSIKSKSLALEPTVFYTILKQAAEKNEVGHSLFGEIVFIGGEPTLNPHLPDYISKTLNVGLKPVVVTNGLKLSFMNYAKKIAQRGSTIVIHIPFMKDYPVYDNYSGVKGYSKKAFQAVSNLVGIRQELGQDSISIIGDFVLNRLTIPYALESYKFCRNHGIVPFFEYMRSSGDNVVCDEIKMGDSDVTELIHDLMEYDISIGQLDVNNRRKMATYFIPPAIGNPCTMTQTSIHVKNNKAGFGDVRSCCGQTLSHGNILIDSLEEIVENKNKYDIFRNQKENILGPCKQCFLYDRIGCEAGCRGNALNNFGCIRASDPQCILIKPYIKNNRDLMSGTLIDCLTCHVKECKSRKQIEKVG